jgi:hypothetical protein
MEYAQGAIYLGVVNGQYHPYPAELGDTRCADLCSHQA